MGEVLEQRSFIRLSISQIASEFAMSRNTVAKRIDHAGIRPDGRRSGYPVYRLRDIIPIVAADNVPAMGDDLDPSRLPPTERRAWYQSENERLKAETESGRLIPAAEVEAEMAVVVTTLVRELETLPDRVERDRKVGPEVVEYLQDEIHKLRDKLYGEMTDAEADEARVSG